MADPYVETMFDLTLKARQLQDRINSLRAEQRDRRGLPARPMKLLLDSIDELKRTQARIANHDAMHPPGGDSPVIS